MKKVVARIGQRFKSVPRQIQGAWRTSRAKSVLLFFKEIVKHPKAMGACFPSSSRLAKAMAVQVPLDCEGIIIELGGGTGVITHALLKHGIAGHRLYVIERSRKLCHYLRQRFPRVNIIQGDASQLSQLIPTQQKIGAIVSGLPLRSLPEETVIGIGRQLARLLPQDAVLIQFTYDLRLNTPFKIPLQRKLSKIVWRNIPPARVDVSQLLVS